MFRGIVFLGLITAAFASEPLDTLVKASETLAAGIQQQLVAVQGESSPVEFAEKTIAYAEAKTAYYRALREAVLELMNIATERETRPPEVDKFAEAFSVAGERQEQAADEATLFLLKRFPGNPDIEKARAEFERAQEVEQRFVKDFKGVDFTERQTARLLRKVKVTIMSV
jgi:hypothetical protein